jgi:hypothetical protein
MEMFMVYQNYGEVVSGGEVVMCCYNSKPPPGENTAVTQPCQRLTTVLSPGGKTFINHKIFYAITVERANYSTTSE